MVLEGLIIEIDIPLGYPRLDRRAEELRVLEIERLVIRKTEVDLIGSKVEIAHLILIEDQSYPDGICILTDIGNLEPKVQGRTDGRKWSFQSRTPLIAIDPGDAEFTGKRSGKRRIHGQGRGVELAEVPVLPLQGIGPDQTDQEEKGSNLHVRIQKAHAAKLCLNNEGDPPEVCIRSKNPPFYEKPATGLRKTLGYQWIFSPVNDTG